MLRCGHGWSRPSPLFSALFRRDFKFDLPFGVAGNSPLSGVVRRYVAAAASILDGCLPAAVAALHLHRRLYLFVSAVGILFMCTECLGFGRVLRPSIRKIRIPRMAGSKIKTSSRSRTFSILETGCVTIVPHHRRRPTSHRSIPMCSHLRTRQESICHPSSEPSHSRTDTTESLLPSCCRSGRC